MDSSVETRMVTRSVLAEIPTVLGHLSIELEHNGIQRFDQIPNIVNSYNFTSHPSPDELVIQQRGRRVLPIVFSPDIDTIKQNREESQTESGGLNKSSILLRNCTRKRLQCDSHEASSSETDQNNGEESQTESGGLNRSSIILRSARKRLWYDSPEPSSSEISQTNDYIDKKLCTEPKSELPEDNCLLLAMKALTSEQLIGIIGQIVNDHPDVEEEIKTNFPRIDIKSLEDQIIYLRHNIYKALPSSRLVSKTDATAYNRVSAHLMDFKKYVIDQGMLLVECHQWIAVLDYVIMAWKYVSSTPIWENPCHNAARRQCFKSLAGICMYALRHMKNRLDPNQCENYKKQLKFLRDDYEELLICLKFLDEFKFD